jgi:hypothetical protein
MKKIVICILLAAGSVAAVSTLFTEYRLRAQMTLTEDQAAVLDFLDQMEFSKQAIVELQTIDADKFVLRHRDGDICVGDISRFMIRCRSKISFPGMMAPSEPGSAVLVKELGSVAKTPLIDEFLRREKTPFTADQKAVIDFLVAMKYPPDEVEDLEILDPPTSFVIKVQNGDICLGELTESLLRCKNELGITSVGFQGDSD